MVLFSSHSLSLESSSSKVKVPEADKIIEIQSETLSNSAKPNQLINSSKIVVGKKYTKRLSISKGPVKSASMPN